MALKPHCSRITLLNSMIAAFCSTEAKSMRGVHLLTFKNSRNRASLALLLAA